MKRALADRYGIRQELGRGGMATVYLAEDVKHHRQLALKGLKPELAEALGPERFLRAIEVTAQLDHPHILPLLDSGEAGGFLYYVMPYVEGESLRHRFNREKQLPLADALQNAREVADALSCAQSHGVVHRDIKPENILLGLTVFCKNRILVSKPLHSHCGPTLREGGFYGQPWKPVPNLRRTRCGPVRRPGGCPDRSDQGCGARRRRRRVVGSHC